MRPPGYHFHPIGIVRSSLLERADAPRQPGQRTGVSGRIELFGGHGYEHALDGLAAWERAWVLFVFHRNVEDGRGWKPKVLPPRSDRKRGVFATRSPHRPNPIGLSAITIERVEGLVVHVGGLDLLDGTPVLDIKPYVAYADAYPSAGAGWLATPDPLAVWEVDLTAGAREQLVWLQSKGVDLGPTIKRALEPGPHPNPYRRIRRQSDGSTLSIKDWRVSFSVDGTRIVVTAIRSGYRRSQLAADDGLAVHRAFVSHWG